MKLLKSNVVLRAQEPGVEGIYKEIEFASRICTHTTDKMSQDSEEWVMNHIIKRGHLRPLEFGTVYLNMPLDEFERYKNVFRNDMWSHYSICFKEPMKGAYITTNLRVLYESDMLDLLQYVAEPNVLHDRRHTFIWDISRGIADELRTHTSISSLMESTRYCKYSAEKFGGELTFIIPDWADESYASSFLYETWGQIESKYMAMIESGLKAEEARDILPLSIKTTFIQCGFLRDWKKLFEQRAHVTDSNKPHPEMLTIAEQAEGLLGDFYTSLYKKQ